VKRGIVLVLLVIAAAGIAVLTGLSMMVFMHSRATGFWLALFPAVVTGLAVALLWRGGRGLRIGSAAVGVALLAFAALVFTRRIDRFDCRQTWQEAPDTRAVARVMDGGALLDDGKGPYVDGTDRVESYMHHLLTIAFPERGRHPRAMRLDLSRPVDGSGAVPLGVVSDVVWLKTYWRQDADNLIHAVKFIAAGATVPSDRVDILMRIDGKLHRLTMGRWAGRYCDAEPGVGGAETTEARITRIAEDRFEVSAPEGSTSRLWDVSASEGPLGPRPAVDRGRYYVNLAVTWQGK
jgi:hypothetical protein